MINYLTKLDYQETINTTHFGEIFESIEAEKKLNLVKNDLFLINFVRISYKS